MKRYQYKPKNLDIKYGLREVNLKIPPPPKVSLNTKGLNNLSIKIEIIQYPNTNRMNSPRKRGS